MNDFHKANKEMTFDFEKKIYMDELDALMSSVL